jgi:hypothetical protein
MDIMFSPEFINIVEGQYSLGISSKIFHLLSKNIPPFSILGLEPEKKNRDFDKTDK